MYGVLAASGPSFILHALIALAAFVAGLAVALYRKLRHA